MYQKQLACVTIVLVYNLHNILPSNTSNILKLCFFLEIQLGRIFRVKKCISVKVTGSAELWYFAAIALRPWQGHSTHCAPCAHSFERGKLYGMIYGESAQAVWLQRFKTPAFPLPYSAAERLEFCTIRANGVCANFSAGNRLSCTCRFHDDVRKGLNFYSEAV